MAVSGTRQSGMARIKSNLGSAVRKGKMSQEAADKVLARVKGTLDYSGFGDVDMVRSPSAMPCVWCMAWAGWGAVCPSDLCRLHSQVAEDSADSTPEAVSVLSTCLLTKNERSAGCTLQRSSRLCEDDNRVLDGPGKRLSEAGMWV